LDITEFKLFGEKLYLSPVLDLFNGEIITYKEHAPYRTTIHSDQGWHYQHHLWVITLKRNEIFQSMYRKAMSMENFFGLLKQEMYYSLTVRSQVKLPIL